MRCDVTDNESTRRVDPEVSILRSLFLLREMDPPRIELGAPDCKSGVLPLDYGPIKGKNSLTNFCLNGI